MTELQEAVAAIQTAITAVSAVDPSEATHAEIRDRSVAALEMVESDLSTLESLIDAVG